MEYLLIPLSCLLAATKILIQGRFAKGKTKTPIDALFFNGTIFATGAVILLLLFDVKVTPTVLIGSLITGIANLSYQMFYIFAFSCGPISLTSLISSISMVVPILFSTFLYNEPLTVNRILGILVTIAALYFTTAKAGKDKLQLRWILFTSLAFLANCFASMSQKIYTKSFAAGDTSSYVVVHFIFSAVISLILYLILTLRGNRCTYPINKSVVFTAGGIGIILCGFHLVYTYAMSVLDASLLMPLYNGGNTLLVTLGSAVFMKEKLTKRQYTGIILGIIAIILMSI